MTSKNIPQFRGWEGGLILNNSLQESLVNIFQFFLDLNPNGGRPIHNLTVIDEYGDITWNRFRKIYKKIDPNNRGNRLEEDFRVLHRDCFNFGKEGKCRKRKKGKPTLRSLNQVQFE